MVTRGFVEKGKIIELFHLLRVRGCGRYPTAGRNQPSAYEYGHLLSDALGAWVRQGLMAGPFDREELPWDEVGS